MSPPEPRKPLPRSLSWADALFGDAEPSPVPAAELPDLPIELPVEDTGPLEPATPVRRLGRRSFRRGLSLAAFRHKGRSGVLALAGGLRTPVLPKRARPNAPPPGRAHNTGPLDLSALEDTDLMEIEASEIEALDVPPATPPLRPAPPQRPAEALSVEESLAAMLGSELPSAAEQWPSEGPLSDEASGITLVRALTLEDVVSSPTAAVAQALPTIPPPLPKLRVEAPPPSPAPVEPQTQAQAEASPPPLTRPPQPRSPSLPPVQEVRSSAPRAPSLPPIIETNSAPPRQPSLIPEVRTPAPRSPSLPPIVEARSAPPRAPSLVPEPRAPLGRSPSLPPTRAPAGASDRPSEAVAWQARKWTPAGPKGEVVVGVDLGTTYSAVAVAEGDEVRVLSTRRGLPTLPSAVAYEATGRALLGDAALRFLPSNPGATIVGWKRLLGRSYDSPIVEEVKRHFAYEITDNGAGNAAVRVYGQTVDLEAVAAEILDELRVAASMQLEGKINRAVITCPAHFGEAQRAAIRRAGELAGFHVERVLSEPTAAALAYGFGKGFDGKRLLVYDLGGGTFDVSLLLVRGETYEVVATGGDSFLGGLDFDATIVRLLVEALQAQEGIDARTDPAAIAKLMQYAERAKRELSTRESTIIEVEHLVVQPHAARSLTLAVKRAQVEKLFSPIIDHTLEIVQDVCQRAGLQPKEIDEVVLVGGQTRTPIISRKVRSMLGKEPRTGIDPDEAVALGAARYAQGLQEKSDVKLVDALPVSIGVGLPGGRFHKLIQRDTPLPASHLHTLRTTRDNQPSLELFFFQGEADQAEHNDPLGSLVLSGLPRGPKGTVVVEVRLRVDEEQVLSVTAKEQKSGKSIETKFGTKTTPAELRSKLGLPPEPSHEDLQKRRYQVGRPKGVWGWLSKVLGR